jgi:hypothetical protein
VSTDPLPAGCGVSASNGTAFARSVGDFDRRQDADASIEWTQTHAVDCPARTTPWRWVLVDDDGRRIVESVQYADTPEVVDQTLAWVRAHAAQCPIMATEAPDDAKGHPRHGRRWRGQSSP